MARAGRRRAWSERVAKENCKACACERCGFESAERSASLGAEEVCFGCSLHAAWQSDAGTRLSSRKHMVLPCVLLRTRRFPKKCARQIRFSELRAEPERRYRVCPGTPRCLFTDTGTCNPVQVKSNQVKLRGEPGSGYVAGCRRRLYVSAIGLCAKCSPPVCSFFHHLNTTLSHPGRQAALEAAMRTSHIYV